MAMTDYPYPSAFLEPMPAFPVNVSCEAYKDIAPQAPEPYNPDTGLSVRQTQMLEALNTSSSVYFNYYGQMGCTNTSDVDGSGTLDAEGWNILACNELPMPVSWTNETMFVEDIWDYDQYTKDCQEKYDLTPQYDWALKAFGGYNVSRDFAGYSNIIFSNGVLDPWMAGGVTEFVNTDLPYFVIEGGAHHLDLRLPNELDKGTMVEWVREQETAIIAKWISDYQPAMTDIQEASQFLQ